MNPIVMTVFVIALHERQNGDGQLAFAQPIPMSLLLLNCHF